MKESTIILEFQKMWRAIHQIAQGFKISVVSQGVRDQALENLLVSKKIFTKEELEAAVKAEAEKLIKQEVTPEASESSEVPEAPKSKVEVVPTPIIEDPTPEVVPSTEAPVHPVDGK